MDRAKRKRLEAAGWQVGTAADFFNLSPVESVYLEMRVRLSEALRTRRSRQGVSQTALALLLGSSQSRVAKMEGGDPSVTLDLLFKALIATGASRAELSRIVGIADEQKPITLVDTQHLDESTVYLNAISLAEEASNSQPMHVNF